MTTNKSYWADTSDISNSDTFCFIYQGSGKTLAFGIPILTHILQRKASQETEGTNNNEGKDIAKASIPVADNSTACSDEIRRPLLGLIMTPTRELALQIRNHLQKAAKHTSLEVQVWKYMYIIIKDAQSSLQPFLVPLHKTPCTVPLTKTGPFGQELKKIISTAGPSCSKHGLCYSLDKSLANG